MCWASAASVVKVPATPTQVLARSTGTTRSASPRRSRTTSRAAATSAAVGGSECRQRSVSRTQPMSAEKLACTPSPSPTTTSVEPPPRSTTTNGAAALSSSPTAPLNDSSASSWPLITSAIAPGTAGSSTSAVIAKNTSRLAASRVADVATMRTLPTSKRFSSAA